MESFTIKINDIDKPVRISEYLKRNLKFSSTLVTRVKFGGVFINGQNVHMRALIKSGDTLSVVFPKSDNNGIEAIDIPLDILFEDEFLLAVNKPKNMPTHPSRSNHLPTLANAVISHFGKDFVFRAINRLDRGTSGIVLIAKDPYTAARLSENMKRGDFSKKYLALVSGVPSPAYDIIDLPIERENADSIKRIVSDTGKRAVTEYKLIKTLDDGNSICEITLHTGRTHQIRVHFSHIGHALVGDFLYGTETKEGYSLHCSNLSFTHPITNERITVKSKADFC